MQRLNFKSHNGFKAILCSFFYLLTCFTYRAQNQQQGCPNANLSMNNFTNWTGYTGNFGNPGATLGIVNGRHTIISTQGFDIKTCGGLPMIPPGYNRSIRLGNQIDGSEGEKISYQLTVSLDNSLFIYKYAVVLEDPDHTAVQQPNFEMRLKNAAGQQINGNCGIYTVYAGQPGQNFQNCNGIKWLPWKTVGVNLSSYMGQTITIEFTTRDCSLGAHFGYAYLVAECMPLYINMNYCIGSNQVTLSAPIGFQNYQWTPGGATTPTITINSPNNNQVYTCSMNSVSNQGNCPVSISTQLTPTVVTANFSHALGCAFQPIQFNSTSTVTPTIIGGLSLPNNVLSSWTWLFGDGTSLSGNNPALHMNPQHTYPTPGIYTVTHISTTVGGCSDTTIQNIIVGAPPQSNFTINGFCQYNVTSFQSQANVPCTYNWNFMDGSQNSNLANPQHIYTAAGNYMVSLIATNSIGCSDTSYQNLVIHPQPIIDAGIDTILCAGDGVLLNASGGTSYNWLVNGANGTQYIPNNDGFLNVIGTDTNGCSNIDSLYIIVNPLPIVEAGDDIFACAGSTITLQGNGTLSYVWTGGISNGAPFIPLPGSYQYTLSGTDLNFCSATDSINITIYANPIVNAGIDQHICEGSSATLTANGAQSYLWNNGIVNSQEFVPLQSTNYTVIGTDNNGCVDSDSVQVAIEPMTNVSFMAPITEGCVPLEVSFTNTSTGTAGVNCVWNFGDGQSESTCSNIDYTYTTPGCYDVQLSVTTALGCNWTATLTDYICVYPNPIASFSPYPFQLSEAVINSNMNNASIGANAYYWDFGDGSMPSIVQDPNHDFPAYPPSNYTILLTATNEHGCTDTMTQTVIVHPSLLIYIPNTFTPDGDQFNQNWLPIFSESVDPYNYDLYLYNRWGETIWESHNLSVGWDGTYGKNGLQVQDGSYTYKINYKLRSDAQRETLTGHVNIIR